jgi:hypothetical protein
MDVHDAVACDNKTAHPAIVPSSTTVTNKDKSTATTINRRHCGDVAKTALVEKPASHDGERSTEDCVSQCDGNGVTEDHCHEHTDDHCR